jgi:hypothetical protein
MKRLWWVLCLLALTACFSQEMGTLAGHVTIEMQPVIRMDVPTPTPAPEAYAVRQVVIFSANGKREVARVQIDSQGNYRITLPVGEYVVDINHAGMDRGIDLPASIEIKAQQVTRLNIAIDTGIR